MAKHIYLIADSGGVNYPEVPVAFYLTLQAAYKAAQRGPFPPRRRVVYQVRVGGRNQPWEYKYAWYQGMTHLERVNLSAPDPFIPT